MPKVRIENERDAIAQVIAKIKENFDFNLAKECITQNELLDTPLPKLKHSNTGLSHSLARVVDDKNKIHYHVLTKAYIGSGEYGKIRLVISLEKDPHHKDFALKARLFKSWGTPEESAKKMYATCLDGVNLYAQYFKTGNPVFFKKSKPEAVTNKTRTGIYQDMPLLPKDFDQWLRAYYHSEGSCPFDLCSTSLGTTASLESIKHESHAEPTLISKALSFIPYLQTTQTAPPTEHALTNPPIEKSERFMQQSAEARKLLHVSYKLMEALHRFHMWPFYIDKANKHKTYHFVHRDIKPDNIVYDEKNDTAYLLDLDFAFPYDLPKTPNPPLAGSVFFISPDTFDTLSYKTDYYAMSAVIALTLHGADLFIHKLAARDALQQKLSEAPDTALSSLNITQQIAAAPYQFTFPHLKEIFSIPYEGEEKSFAGLTNYQVLIRTLELMGHSDFKQRLESLEHAQHIFEEIQLTLLRNELNVYFATEEIESILQHTKKKLAEGGNYIIGNPLPKLLAQVLSTSLKAPEAIIGQILRFPELAMSVNAALPVDSPLRQRFAKSQLLHTTDYFISLARTNHTTSVYEAPTDILHSTSTRCYDTPPSKEAQRANQKIKEIIKKLRIEAEDLRVIERRMAKLPGAGIFNLFSSSKNDGIKSGKASFIEKEIIPKMQHFEEISESEIKISKKHVGVHYYVNKVVSVQTTTESLIQEYNDIIKKNRKLSLNGSKIGR